MPQIDKFGVAKIDGLKETDKGLAFLQCATRKDIDAKHIFDKLKPKRKADLLNRIDYWLDGNHYDKYFHGFPGDPVYDQCYVFKWQQAGAQHRLYGFLTHPRTFDVSFQVCILVCHGQKPGGDHHDPAKLALAESLRVNVNVFTVVVNAFGELLQN